MEFLFVITVCLSVAKLMGYVAWSWWWITAPVWLPTLAMVVFAILYEWGGAIIEVICDLFGLIILGTAGVCVWMWRKGSSFLSSIKENGGRF